MRTEKLRLSGSVRMSPSRKPERSTMPLTDSRMHHTLHAGTGATSLGGADTARVPRRNHYNDDPDLLDVPLSLDEVTVLLGDPKVVGRNDTIHLLRRVLATVQRAEAIRRHYDEELRRRTTAMPRSGLPATLSPEEAVKFLSPEQVFRLFDRFSQEKLAILENLRERAAAERQKTIVAATLLRDAFAALSAGGVDDTERARLLAVADSTLKELDATLDVTIDATSRETGNA